MRKINPQKLHKVIYEEVKRALVNPMPRGAVCSTGKSAGEKVRGLMRQAQKANTAKEVQLIRGRFQKILQDQKLSDDLFESASRELDRVIAKRWQQVKKARGQ